MSSQATLKAELSRFWWRSGWLSVTNRSATKIQSPSWAINFNKLREKWQLQLTHCLIDTNNVKLNWKYRFKAREQRGVTGGKQINQFVESCEKTESSKLLTASASERWKNVAGDVERGTLEVKLRSVEASCDDEVMRVTAHWIILGWLILLVNKKDCSQTSCKSCRNLPSRARHKLPGLRWKELARAHRWMAFINPDSLLCFGFMLQGWDSDEWMRQRGIEKKA